MLANTRFAILEVLCVPLQYTHACFYNIDINKFCALSILIHRLTCMRTYVSGYISTRAPSKLAIGWGKLAWAFTLPSIERWWGGYIKLCPALDVVYIVCLDTCAHHSQIPTAAVSTYSTLMHLCSPHELWASVAQNSESRSWSSIQLELYLELGLIMMFTMC